jgi:energy-coupling factor transporter ATP-binding protein EcfA2
MSPDFIAFFGPDGSGKSTQATLLIEYLRSRKIKVKKVWIRSPHTLAYLLSRFLVKVGYYRSDLTPYGLQQKTLSLPNNVGFKYLWYLIELASIGPLILFKVYIPMSLGYTVIAERYVVDTIVNIAYYANDLKFLGSHIAKLFLRLIPRDACLIHLDSDYLTIQSRRGRAVDSSSFIEFERLAYDSLKNLVSAETIFTSCLDIAQTSKKIKNLVECKIS